MNRVEQMKQVQKEGLELFTKKNADYGDAFAKYGVIGVLMRIEDKIQRSLSISKNGVNLIKDEGIRDTLIDLHNYAAMALMLMDEKDKKEELPNEVLPIIINAINKKNHHKYFFPEFIINIKYINDETAYLYFKDINDNIINIPSGIIISLTDYKYNTNVKIDIECPNKVGHYLSWLNDYEITFNETPILRIIRSVN